MWKTSRLEVNDIFDELKYENIRLNKQILFIEKFTKLLDKFRDNLNVFNNCCKCEQNVKNKTILIDLQNEYKCVSDEFMSVLKSDNQTEQSSVNSSNNSVDRPLLLVTRNMIRKSIKRELSSESDEDFDANNDNFDDNDSDDENYSINSSKKKNKKMSKPIDISVYLNNESNSAFVKKRRNGYSTENLACNFSGCQFECLHQDRMNRHIETYHSSKEPVKCEECNGIYWTTIQLGNHIKKDHKQLYDTNTQKFICRFVGCNNQFKKFSQLASHKRRHTGEKSFKCCKDFVGCHWSFFTAGELRNHQVAVHTVQKYYCDWIGCGEGFKIKSDLDLHKLHKHSDSKKTNLELLETINDPFNNYIPDRTHLKTDFDTNYCVVKHLNTNKIRYFICNYNYCDFKCSVGTKMEKHIKELHLDKNPIKCQECDQLFWSHKSLTNHIRPNHPNIYDQLTQMFKCSFDSCGLSFDRYSKLLVHQKRHFGQKSFKCADKYPNCNWNFFTIGELKNHQMWSHSEEFPYLCDWDGCNRRFKLRNLLADHKLTHTPEEMPFKCEWPGCDMRYVRKNALKVHMECHIGSKDYRCDWPECGHTFRNKSNLKAHYAIHTNIRRHRCDWPGCDSRFISSTSLNRHKLVHQNISPFECLWPHCHKKFKSKTSLKVHDMSHRGDKPFKCEALDCDMRFVEKKQMRKHYKRRHLPKI